jgi:hypothetical protein
MIDPISMKQFDAVEPVKAGSHKHPLPLTQEQLECLHVWEGNFSISHGSVAGSGHCIQCKVDIHDAARLWYRR